MSPHEMLGCDLRWERRLRIAVPRLTVLLGDAAEFRGYRRVLLRGEGPDDNLRPRRRE